MADSPASASLRAGPAAQSSAGDSPLLSLLPHIRQLLRREPALAVTLGYLFVAIAGIFYNYSFYRKFDIPVLSLSQVSDFLVAGIQQPVAILLVLSTLPLCWLFDRLSVKYRQRKLAERQRLLALPAPTRWQRGRLKVMAWTLDQPLQEQATYLLVVLIYGAVFVGAYAQYQADAVKHGRAGEVAIWLNGETERLAPAQSPAWAYLGAVGNYVFVYDREAGRAQILPVNAVARIEPLPRPRQAAAPAADAAAVAPNP